MEELANIVPFPEEIDSSLLELHLSLSPEERLRRHDGALALFCELRAQGEALRERATDAESE